MIKLNSYRVTFSTPWGDSAEYIDAINKKEAKEKFIKQYGKCKNIKIELL